MIVWDNGTKKQRVYEIWEDNFHDPVSYANFYFNEVYGKYFTEKPARSCVAVKDLPKAVLVEVEVIATINE